MTENTNHLTHPYYMQFQQYPELLGPTYLFSKQSNISDIAKVLYSEYLELTEISVYSKIDDLISALNSEKVANFLMDQTKKQLPPALLEELFEMDYISDFYDTYQETKSFEGSELFEYGFWSEILNSNSTECKEDIQVISLEDFTVKIEEGAAEFFKKINADEPYGSACISFESTLQLKDVFNKSFFQYPEVMRFVLDYTDKILELVDLPNGTVSSIEKVCISINRGNIYSF